MTSGSGALPFWNISDVSVWSSVVPMSGYGGYSLQEAAHFSSTESSRASTPSSLNMSSRAAEKFWANVLGNEISVGCNVTPYRVHTTWVSPVCVTGLGRSGPCWRRWGAGEALSLVGYLISNASIQCISRAPKRLNWIRKRISSWKQTQRSSRGVVPWLGVSSPP